MSISKKTKTWKSLPIDAEIHRMVKVRSSGEGVTMSKYVERILQRAMGEKVTEAA